MKATLIFVFIFLLVVTVLSLFIGYEEKQIPQDETALENLREKFLKIDINDKDLDLDKAIKEIKEVRKIYPLDDKLKMVDMELEHKRTDKPYPH